MDTLFLSEHRCKCGKLLLKGIFFDGTLEIKCRRCGEMNKIGSIKLANDATHYLLIINDQGIITNVSESACLILGYICDELIGKHFSQINPTMSKEMGKKFFGSESVLNEENYFLLDTTHQAKEGKKIPVRIFLKLYRPIGREKYVLVSAELKNAVSSKKISDIKTLDFLDNACDFYFDIDKNGTFEYTSPSVEQLFGFSPESFIGKNYFDFLSVEIKAEAKKTFEHFSAQGQPYRAIHEVVIDANSKRIHSELYFTPNFDDLGKFVGYSILGWLLKNPQTGE